MNTHPYLRAFLAGLFLPSIFLLFILASYVALRVVWNIPIPIERSIAFPMALVPNAWGLWNMLHLRLPKRWRLPIGFHGALLPVLLSPIAYVVAATLDLPFFSPQQLLAGILAVMIFYYLLWKFVVGWLNHVLGIA